MDVTIFEFISGLEADLVNFYKQLKLATRLPRSAEVVDLMIRQSGGHSDTVEALTKKHRKPEFQREFFLDIHRQIKTSLIDEIREAGDTGEVIEKLARSEELVSKMYTVLAQYYKKLGEYYRDIAIEIEEIAAEEIDHRDVLLNEKRKYAR